MHIDVAKNILRGFNISGDFALNLVVASYSLGFYYSKAFILGVWTSQTTP